jgi:hypothetical protein
MSKSEVTHIINKRENWLRKPHMNYCYNSEWLSQILEPDTKIKIDHIKASKTWEKHYDAKIAKLNNIENLRKDYIELYNRSPKGCKTYNIDWLIAKIKMKKEDDEQYK